MALDGWKLEDVGRRTNWQQHWWPGRSQIDSRCDARKPEEAPNWLCSQKCVTSFQSSSLFVKYLFNIYVTLSFKVHKHVRILCVLTSAKHTRFLCNPSCRKRIVLRQQAEAKKRAEKKDAEANHNFHFRPTQTSIMKEKPVVCLSASWGGSVYGEVRIQVDLCIWQYLISTSPLSHAIVFILSDAISLLRCRSARSRRCVAWRRCWWRSLQGCLSSPSPVDCNRRNTKSTVNAARWSCGQ